MERTQGKAVEVADSEVEWAKLQRVGEAAAAGPGDRPPNPGLQQRKIKSQKPLAVKISGNCGGGRNSSLTGEFVGETNRVQERTQNH